MVLDSRSNTTSLKKTPLNALHKEYGARMVEFSGFEMPLQYRNGIIKEHEHTRLAAGLFDVSHMGQGFLTGNDPGVAIEKLVPSDIMGLSSGNVCYTLLLNDDGGIIDDLLVSNLTVSKLGPVIYVVLNAVNAQAKFCYISEKLKNLVEVKPASDRALVALQGPMSEMVISRYFPAASELVFMQAKGMTYQGVEYFVSRSGYTGEDGFEISLPEHCAEHFVRCLVNEPEVELIGLGARDTLRLEAGLCLYGNDIDESTTPIESGLNWTVSKRRRQSRNFPGANLILEQIEEGVAKLRVGLLPQGRVSLRPGSSLFDKGGNNIGVVTSGCYSPTLKQPVAMGYLLKKYSEIGTTIYSEIRGRDLEIEVAKLPFVNTNYYRGK
ncbi:MAG: glycine cleavage system protein T [Alphaproteobacteria bacterium]|jgi:aminomethyltransferase|nr:glycine cleavage system protein T [Alphaproteobacteria bacterium]PPR14396.1 MAG: Aminomethyltransferase [Alphaproteobacteria bacterium MarineAlpha12_Bin1]|tara:strand:+ start:3943 stop:5085 length:1143 start_codon:yes stop_codon:yes gene_type:complete